MTAPAKRKRNRFSLPSEKTCITAADVSERRLVVARTTPHTEVARKTDGFTLFAADLKARDVDLQRMKIRIPVPEERFTVFFDDVDTILASRPSRYEGCMARQGAFQFSFTLG